MLKLSMLLLSIGFWLFGFALLHFPELRVERNGVTGNTEIIMAFLFAIFCKADYGIETITEAIKERKND